MIRLSAIECHGSDNDEWQFYYQEEVLPTYVSPAEQSAIDMLAELGIKEVNIKETLACRN